jgi:hypothetical protein
MYVHFYLSHPYLGEAMCFARLSGLNRSHRNEVPNGCMEVITS